MAFHMKYVLISVKVGSCTLYQEVVVCIKQLNVFWVRHGVVFLSVEWISAHRWFPPIMVPLTFKFNILEFGMCMKLQSNKVNELNKYLHQNILDTYKKLDEPSGR